MRCLHLADLHLGWSATFLDDEQREQFTRRRNGLLHRVCQFVLDERQSVDLVLIVGDLFDTHRPEPALVESVLADLRALLAAGKTVVTVPGNHDEITYHDSVYQRYRDRWPGYLISNPLPAAPLELEIAGQPVFVYSLAYTGGLTRFTGKLAPWPRVAAEGLHIGAFHGSLDVPGDERSLPLASAALVEAGYDYVALGHWHASRLHTRGRTTIAYAGAIEAKGFSDLGCGQLTLLDHAVGGQMQVSHVPFAVDKYRVQVIDLGRLDGHEQLDQLITGLADPKLLLQLRLTGALTFLLDPATLLARHRRSFYHLELVADQWQLSDQLLSEWAEEPTVRGQFVRRIAAKLVEASDQEQRQLLQLALQRGIAAFMRGGE